MLTDLPQWLLLDYLRSHPGGITCGEVGAYVLTAETAAVIRAALMALVEAGDAIRNAPGRRGSGTWGSIFTPTAKLLARDIGPKPAKPRRRESRWPCSTPAANG
jgi:hypothetical protein